MERALLLISIAIAIRGLQRDGLLHDFEAERLVERGGDTMALLDLHRGLIGKAATRDLDREPGGDELRARAAGMTQMAVEVLDAGGWAAIVAGAPAHAIETWDSLVAVLREAHGIEPRPHADGVGVDFDMAAKTVLITGMTLEPTLDRWSVSRVDAPGREDHGWPTVTGKIYGDPRFDDGKEVTVYAVVQPVGRTAIGLHGLTYDLGRPA